MRGINPTQVPTIPVEVDREHPLAQGIRGFWLPGLPPPSDLTGRYPSRGLMTIAGATYYPQIGGTPIGPAYYSPSTNAPCAWVVNDGPIIGGRPQFSILAIVQTTFSTINPGLDIYAERAPSGNDIVQLTLSYGGSVGVNNSLGLVLRDDPGNLISIMGDTVINDGKLHYVGATLSIDESTSVGDWQLFIDGSLNASGSGTLTTAFTNSGLLSSISGDTQATTAIGQPAAFEGYIPAVGVYDGVLPPSAFALWRSEPFAMLRPIRRRTYFVPASSGTDVTVFGASAKAGAGVLTAAISFRPPGASVATAASPLSGVVSAPIAGADAKANAGNVSFAVQTGVTGTTAQSRAGFLTSEISIAAPSATAHLAASSLLPAVEPHLSGASVAALAQPLSTKNNDVNAGVVGATMTMYASPLSVSIVNVSPAIERLLLWGSPYSEDNNVSNTSGTYTYAPALSEILVEAFERCGMRTSELTQEHYLSGRRTMNLVQSAWSNRGINLWKVDLVKVLMPQGQISYPVDADVINVLDTYLRQFDLGMPVNVPPKFSTVAGSDVVTITAPTSSPFAAGFYISINVPVSVGGIVVGGFYEVQSVIDGTTYTIQAASNATATVNQGGVVPVFSTVAGSQNVTVTFPNHGYLPGQSFTAQIPTTVGGVVIGGPYVVTSVPSSDTFVIGVPYPAGATATGAENGGNTAIAQQSLMSQFTQSSDPYDLLLYPLSRNDYAAIPDKLGQGRPTSYWFDRTNPGTINVWPVPDANGPYQLCYYVFRQMQDAMPANGQQGDMPQRFFEAYTAEVAAHLAMKWAPPERAIALKQYAQAAYAEAQAEDREKVSTYWVPEMSGYFRK